MTGEQIRAQLNIAPVQVDHTRSAEMQRVTNEYNLEGARSMVEHVALEAGTQLVERGAVHGVSVAGATFVASPTVVAGTVIMGAGATAVGLVSLARREINTTEPGRNPAPQFIINEVRREETVRAGGRQQVANSALERQYSAGSHAGLQGSPPARPTDRAYMAGYNAGAARRTECGPARIDAERTESQRQQNVRATGPRAQMPATDYLPPSPAPGTTQRLHPPIQLPPM